jgi:hypothetical protein
MSTRSLLRVATVTLAVVLAAGASLAYAQNALVMDTTFAFSLGRTVYQPGKYELRPNSDESNFQILPAKGAASFAAVVTRLEKPEPASSEAKVVFDKVGDAYFLSEIWIPGSDGYLMHVTKEKHTHVRVKPDKKGL